MADRDLQAVLNTGEITNIFIGGVTASDRVIKLFDLTSLNISFDKTGTSLISTNAQTALVELANVGYVHLSLVEPYRVGQVLGVTPTKLSLFDTIIHDINGTVTPLVDTSESVPAHKFTIDKTGTYDMKGVITAEFSTSNNVSVELYKNGVATGAKANLQGRGTGKAVQFTYVGLIDLVATDYLELYAYADSASVSTLITSSTVILERKAI